MAQGLSANLLLPAAISALIGFLFIFRQLHVLPSLFIIFIKLSITIIYFAYFEGIWFLSDDWDYLERSQSLLDHFTLIELITTNEGLKEFFIQAQGHHILYYIWNVFGQTLFGDYYYSTVFLNIVLTFICGFYFYKIIRIAGFSQTYAKAILVFFLLHWDLLVWSSFFNLKDVLVMTLTAIGLYSLIKLISGFKWIDMAVFLLTLFALFWIRFYIAFFLLLVAGLWYFLKVPGKRKWIILLLIISGMYYLLPEQSIIKQFSAGQFLFGFARFPITPQPWSIEPVYGFLLLPSILNWIFILPAFYGALILWRKTPVATIALSYVVILWMFYASFPDLQGPRHRVQITFIICWAQFHFIWMLLKSIVKPRSKMPLNQGIGL